MKDQRPTFEGIDDRRHPLISEPLVRSFGGVQFPHFSGLVTNFTTGLIGGFTRRVRIVRFDEAGPRGELVRRP